MKKQDRKIIKAEPSSERLFDGSGVNPSLIDERGQVAENIPLYWREVKEMLIKDAKDRPSPLIIDTGFVWGKPKTYCVGCGKEHDHFAFNACWDCIESNKVKKVDETIHDKRLDITVTYKTFVKR